MSNEMTAINKEASVWIVIRVLGLLLLGKTIVLLGALLVHLASICNLLTAASIVGAHPDEQASSQLWGPAILLVLEAVIFALLSYYFLRRGLAIHRLLSHEAARM